MESKALIEHNKIQEQIGKYLDKYFPINSINVYDRFQLCIDITNYIVKMLDSVRIPLDEIDKFEEDRKKIEDDKYVTELMLNKLKELKLTMGI